MMFGADVLAVVDDRSPRNTEDSCRFRLFHSFAVDEPRRGADVPRQSAEEPRAVVHRHDPVLDLAATLARTVLHQADARSFVSQLVQAVIGGDSADPTPPIARRGKRVHAPVNSEKCLLRRVFGSVVALQEAPADGANDLRMGSIENVKADFVFLSGLDVHGW